MYRFTINWQSPAGTLEALVWNSGIIYSNILQKCERFINFSGHFQKYHIMYFQLKFINTPRSFLSNYVYCFTTSRMNELGMIFINCSRLTKKKKKSRFVNNNMQENIINNVSRGKYIVIYFPFSFPVTWTWCRVGDTKSEETLNNLCFSE